MATTEPARESKPHSAARDVPGAAGKLTLPKMADSWSKDLVSGFLVFLIALPLCLGIAKASGCPPIAGVVTAVIGGLLSGIFSNSELTIKGPAAGMIVIVLNTVIAFGYQQTMPPEVSVAKGATVEQEAAYKKQVHEIETGNIEAYRMMLAVGVIAGIIQIILGVCRAGVLGDFFPSAPVHGLLASIGLIIMAKQLHPMLGKPTPKGGPVTNYLQIPETLSSAPLKVAGIGVLCLAILAWYPVFKKRLKVLDKIPAQLVVVVVGVLLGLAFQLGSDQLIFLPDNISSAIVTPNFSRIMTAAAAQWITMFVLVGTLESMLSAKAIDFLDPWKRKTSMDRDILGVGVANTAAAAIGGLPMISEILRSSANITYGARTRLSNLFHGLFLALAMVLLLALLKLIPNAVLGALLVFAGFRLASPKQFIHMWHTGKDQFLVFCLTIAFIIPQGNLLAGIGVGLAAELILNFLRGASLPAFFKSSVRVDQSGDKATLFVDRSLTFTNWLSLRRQIEKIGDAKEVTVDCSRASFIDQTVRERIDQLKREFGDAGRRLTFVDLATAA
jgi:MFS superfamily sulfate permease-like transporter